MKAVRDLSDVRIIYSDRSKSLQVNLPTTPDIPKTSRPNSLLVFTDI